jgi:hypothetical protein
VFTALRLYLALRPGLQMARGLGSQGGSGFGAIAASVTSAMSEAFSLDFGAYAIAASAIALAVRSFRPSAWDLMLDPGAAVTAVSPKLLAVLAVGAAIVGAGAYGTSALFGTSKGDLEDAINASLAKLPAHCYSFRSMAGVTFPLEIETVGSVNPILAGLQSSGFITLQPGTAMFGRTLTLDLTAQSKAAQVWNPQTGFCLGRPQVKEVLSFTEPKLERGVERMVVRYSWDLQSRPQWLDPAHFSQIDGVSTPVETSQVLTKTNAGWTVLGG